MLLDAEPDITVAAEVGTGSQAIAAARRHDPDVVLMDIRMPDMDGIEATAHLVRAGSRAKILMLTTFDHDDYIYRAMRAGASGFLLKDANRSQLINAVRTVSAGRCATSPIDHPPPSRGTLPKAPRQRRRRGGRAPEPARGRSSPADRNRTHQRRDSQTALPQRRNSEKSRRPHPCQTRATRPRPSSNPRLRDRHGAPRRTPVSRHQIPARHQLRLISNGSHRHTGRNVVTRGPAPIARPATLSGLPARRSDVPRARTGAIVNTCG